ncbi:putative membrane protein, partial [Halorubrum alkaliphilum]|nr:putative membrane protein [Halorubrum alkaliphilum]
MVYKRSRRLPTSLLGAREKRARGSRGPPPPAAAGGAPAGGGGGGVGGGGGA